MSLLILNEILFWSALFFLGWNVYFLIFNKGIPNIRTAPALRRKMCEIIEQHYKKTLHEKNTPYRIVDLGSGNGQLTRDIAKKYPDATVIGVEISKQQLYWANRLKNAQKLENLSYIETDFFDYDLSKADVVLLYQLEMHKIGQKLKQELKPGSLIISNRFQLGGGWADPQLINVFTLYPHQKQLYVYRVE